MTEMNDLKKRLTALEQENARLRKTSGKAREVVTVVGTYKGFPILRFEGPFRPFCIGVGKASAILEKLDDIRFFVENNRHRLPPAGECEAA